MLTRVGPSEEVWHCVCWLLVKVPSFGFVVELFYRDVIVFLNRVSGIIRR